ncbi:MAG: hypothetical protein VX768_04490 [Planctomycetota bacterium]|nr:hypothetical protein [Planctomycetota bacterium]
MLKKVGICKEMIRLASKGLDTRLSLPEAFALKFHNLLCRACRGYTRELRQLHQLALKRQMEFEAKIDEDRKQRLKTNLEKQISESDD